MSDESDAGAGGDAGTPAALPDVQPATTTGASEGVLTDFGPFHIIWPDSAPQSYTRLWANTPFSVTWAKLNAGPGDIDAHKDRFWITDDSVPNGDPVFSTIVAADAIPANAAGQGAAQVTSLAPGTYTFHAFVNCDDPSSDSPSVHRDEVRYDNNETFSGGLQFEAPS